MNEKEKKTCQVLEVLIYQEAGFPKTEERKQIGKLSFTYYV
jgi:hypothetical protein